MADQQYCLRWNNHQPTLAGCFDRMLKDDQFTDCTLSAEGVNVVAHRMLLSACSPYFNELFKVYNKQQFPIVILRDVSLVELKALMDYMYRGEVNISQDQLADLLKVAEMLQIKGLYEAGFSETRASAPAPAAPRVSAVARPQPLDLPPDITSDGAASPAPRRRKRARRRSSSDDFPTTIDVAAEPIGQAVAPAVPLQAEPVNNVATESALPVPPKLEEHQFDVVLPKEEYVDDQDSIENITLDDDDMDEMDQAGPSHGDGSSQGYPPSWHQSDRSTEDLFLSAQDSINNAGGAQRDSQARKSIPALQSVKRAEKSGPPNVATPPLPSSRIFMEPSSDIQILNESVAVKSLELLTSPVPSTGLRHYQLILPKPATPATGTERHRNARVALKQRPKTNEQTPTKPFQPELPPSTKPPTMILPRPSKPQMIMPQPPPTMMMPEPTIVVQQSSPMLMQPPQTMMLAPPMFMSPPTTIVTPHLAVVSTPPTPVNVKWPLPPKPSANSTASATNHESNAARNSVGAKLSKRLALKAKPSSTPKRADSKEVGRPVTNGYQCCFCNDLVGTMSELMTHLRTCSGLAAAKM